MKRKINSVGQSTFTVSLPAEWAKYHNLKKGDEIEIVDLKTKLELIPHSSATQI